jgi:hypothetical protein
MPDEEKPKVPGRPRRHASDGARGVAYQRRAAGAGLVRVSVMVPATRRPDIIAIAAAMRTLRRAPAERMSDAGPYLMAGKPWRLADDTLLRLVWRDGDTVAELTSLQRPLDQVLARLVSLEEVGSVAEARAEFLARDRAEAVAEIGIRRS